MKDTLKIKTEALRKVEEEIRKCKVCDKHKIGLLVPGEGNPDAKIMFVGEAAGPTESKFGRPFIGRSGRFLTKMLESIGIKREEVFITSPVKYYPGKRTPSDEEVMHGMIHTKKQIEIINPKLIVTLGNVALKALVSKKLTVLQVHGSLQRKNGMIIFPTFHPAAAMRFPKIKKAMKKDFQKLKSLISGL